MRYALLLSLLLLAVSPVVARSAPNHGAIVTCPENTTSAAALVERFFARDGFPDHARFYTGEMLQAFPEAPTLGSLLTDGTIVQHRPIVVTCERAVYATTLSTETGGQDWYLFLVREGTDWKIEAVRTLAMTGIFLPLIETLTEDPEIYDRLPEEYRLPQSGAQMLANMRLVISTDAALKEYFVQQQEALRQLVSDFEHAPAVEVVTSDGHSRPEPSAVEVAALLEQIRNLNLNAIERQQARPGCIFVSIGGILDNEVGYLYAPPGCAIPAITPDDYILLEPIAPQWFLFKTT